MRMTLLLALVGLPLLGGINYMRNAPLDEELRNRPYAGISDADLQALIAAYRGQVEHAKASVESEPGVHAYSDPARFGDYGDKVQAFESFQGANERWKRARSRLFGEQSTLDALLHEESVRARNLHTPLGRILRRVTTL